MTAHSEAGEAEMEQSECGQEQRKEERKEKSICYWMINYFLMRRLL